MNIHEMLSGARDRLNTPGDDPDKLARALTLIHSALEEHCRQALSVSSVRSQHGLDANNKRAVSWQQIPELMQQYYGWSQQDIRYVVRMNSIRNKVNHGGRFEGSRAELKQYLQYVENKVASGAARNGAGSSEEDSSFNSPPSSQSFQGGTFLWVATGAAS